MVLPALVVDTEAIHQVQQRIRELEVELEKLKKSMRAALGSGATPTTDASQLTSGQLADARFLNALLLDGTRIVLDDISFGVTSKGLKFFDDVWLRATNSNDLRVTDKANTVYRNFYCRSISLSGEFLVVINDFVIRTNTETGTGAISFKSFDGADWITAARLGTIGINDPTFYIPRAGDITMLDDKILISDAIIPLEHGFSMIGNTTNKAFKRICSQVLHHFPMSSISGGIEGDVFYDSIAKKLKVFNGTAWETVSSS